MALEAYRLRYRRVHAASVVASGFAVAAASVFVLGRVFSGRRPEPLVRERDVNVSVNEQGCDCSCEDNVLQCAPIEGGYYAQATLLTAQLNNSLCFRAALYSDPTGPTATLASCSCAGEALGHGHTCRVTFSFDERNVWSSRISRLFLLAVACAALFWDIQYIVNLYWRIIPTSPAGAVHIEWFQQWLQGDKDLLHRTAMWTIWGTLLASAFALGGSASPSPRDFASPGVRAAAGWGPTGVDELVLWSALAIFVVIALFMLCVVPSAVLPESGAGNGDGASDLATTPKRRDDSRHQPAPTLHARGALAVSFAAGSFFFLSVPPFNVVFALAATVPWWAMQILHGMKASWPLERPCFSFGDPWAMPPMLAQKHDEALERTADFEALQDWRVSSEAAARLLSLCRVVLEIRGRQPWRAPFDLEVRMQAVLIDNLRQALDTRDAAVLRHLRRSATILGYVPPLREERHEDEDEPSRSSTACTGCCWMRYQRLTGVAGDEDAMRPLARDEAWCAEVHSALTGAMSAAVTSARRSGDEPSSRWLGACLASLQPGAVQEVAGHLAYASDCLRSAVPDETLEPSELFQLVAAAAGPYSDVEGAGGITAFGWALRMPYRQSCGTASLMFEQLPRRGSEHKSSHDIFVVDGREAFASIDGRRAISHRDATIGAIGNAVPSGKGRWFFEVRIFGHAPVHGAPSTTSTPCRIGWLHYDKSAAGLTGSATASAQGEGTTLRPATSCSMDELAYRPVGENTRRQALEVFATPQTPFGCGVVGCALEVSESPDGNDKFKAWFALEGDWGSFATAAPEEGRTAAHQLRSRREWDAPAKPRTRGALPTPLIPCVAGRFACEFALGASEFTFGPPDESFRPLAQTDDCDASPLPATFAPQGDATIPPAQNYGRVSTAIPASNAV